MAFKNLGAACLVFFAGLAGAQAPAASTAVTSFITAEALFQAFALPAWPQDGSALAAEDLQEVLTAQMQRTPSDVQEALLDANRSPHAWAQAATALGAEFTEQRYPATTALLLALHEDMRAINRAGNLQKGHRARPPVVDPRIKSIFADNLTLSASYPSARSASSRVWALLLGDVFPARRAALRAHADRTAELRLLGGAHFPSDIRAGQQVGDAYYAQALQNTLFQQALNRAKLETTGAKPPP